MKKILLTLFFIPTILASQVQIGQNIIGEEEGDQSGQSVCLNGDGTVVAIGAAYNDGNGSVSGHVRVYENIGGVWTQIGQDIDGEEAIDYSGSSVSLSEDGTILAIGATGNDGNGSSSGHVRVYENVGGVWTQIGQDIDGESTLDAFGISISLSSDGDIVAIGAPGDGGNGPNSGHVRVYENIVGVWTQIGQDIDGEVSSDESGDAISLNSDGSIVAIGASGNDGNGTDSGHVRVFENQSGIWTQIGQDIDGENAFDAISGLGVNLNADGTVVAIGASINPIGDNYGHVRVYKNIGGVWTQIGQDIDGEATDDRSGTAVSLSSNGNIIAIGAPLNDGNGPDSGHVRVFENQSGTWTQIGLDIDGQFDYHYSGSSVSLSSNGNVLSVGAPANAGSGNLGYVSIYDLNDLLSTESYKLDYFNIYPNPVQDKINIDLKEGVGLEKVNIYNSLGQFIFSTQSSNIRINKLKSGIYFFEVETSKGKSIKKIIIK